MLTCFHSFYVTGLLYLSSQCQWMLKDENRITTFVLVYHWLVECHARSTRGSAMSIHAAVARPTARLGGGQASLQGPRAPAAGHIVVTISEDTDSPKCFLHHHNRSLYHHLLLVIRQSFFNESTCANLIQCFLTGIKNPLGFPYWEQKGH